MSTYNWDISQSGNIRLTGKMVPAGVDPYPLLSAGSLSWDDVEVENGVYLNTTDDLLNYIKGGNGTINGRIDELELSNAGYEIRCNKSVCYVGDTLDKVSVQIYKNGSLLTWTQIQTEGITLKTPITKPAGGNDLMWFTSNGQWLNGTANVAGTYVFEFMKNDVCIALFRFIVLIPAYKSATITVYKSSDTLPLKPVGVSYNFNSNPASINVGESGWATSTTGLTGTIWFCTGHVNEANPSVVSWNEPCIYLNSKIVNTENEYRVKEIAVYKACHGAYTDGTNSYSEAVAAKPTGSGAQHCYLFNVDPSLDSFTAPGGWSETPQAAIDAYKNSQSTPTNLKSNYVVWKTYNSYRITVNKLTTPNTLVADSYAESGWTTPVKYMDIDLILKEAKTQSLSIANSAIAAARADLEAGLNLETIIDAVNVLFAWRIVGDGNSSLPSDYTELIDDADTTSTQHELFSRFSSYIDSSTNKYTGHIEMINSSPNLCIPGYQMKALKFDPILEDGAPKGCKWIAFVPTTTEIRTLISDLNDDLGELSTAVNSMKPDEIRLQVSKGFMEDVTWTEVDENEWADARTEMIEDPEDEESDFWYYGADMTTRSKRHGYKYVNGDYEQIYAEYDSTSNSYDYLSGLPVKADVNNGGYVYGHYYIVSKPGSVSDHKYFRCDYPISTGFLNILADKLKLGVVNTTGARSTLLLKVDGVSSSAQLSASLIVLDGDTIADAINAKSLNINNTTYLNTDGSVFFGVPNGTAIANPSTSSTLPTATGGIKRSSRFNTDGSGELCGGNINWTSNGVLYVKEAHIGESGSDWLIKTVSDLPTIYSKDNSTNQELFITPQYLNAVKNSTTYWAIQRDGYAKFAQGRAEFSKTGEFHLGGLPNTQTTSGKKDGYMHFDPTEGTLTIGGENVVIASGVMALITAGVADTDEFASIVADAASRSVSINGMLATQDIDVGNGSSYFSTGHDTKTYHGHTYNSTTSGAGHLANGNIWWDKVGNLHAKGLMTNRCEYIDNDNDNQTVVLDGNNLHSVTLAPMEHRMVVLPTYNDFTDPKGGWFVKGYKEDGTVINIKTESCDNFSNWSMIDEEAWFDSGNWTNTADLFKHCTLVCADPATLCTGGGSNGNLPVHNWKGASPTTQCTVFAEFKDNAMLNTEEDVDFPYYEGRFCARGAYSRFILLPPGQSLTLVSSIQKINVGTTEAPVMRDYLIWNIENASEFNFIKMGIVDRLNNSDMFDENNGLMESRREENGVGDGLLSYKYMSLNYYTKENGEQQSVIGPDVAKSIYILLYEASAIEGLNYPGNIVIPSWKTVTLNTNTRSAYTSVVNNSVNVNNLNPVPAIIPNN